MLPIFFDRIHLRINHSRREDNLRIRDEGSGEMQTSQDVSVVANARTGKYAAVLFKPETWAKFFQVNYLFGSWNRRPSRTIDASFVRIIFEEAKSSQTVSVYLVPAYHSE